MTAIRLPLLYPPRHAGQLGRVTVWLLAVASVALASAVALYGWLLVLGLGSYDDASIDTWTAVFDGLFLVVPWVILVAGLSLLAWVFTTVRLVHAVGRGEDLVSPSAGAYLTLMLAPYGVIKELRRAVAVQDHSLGGHLLGAWWAAWLGAVVLTGVGARYMNGDVPLPDDVRVVAILGLAWALAWTIMSGLTAWNVRVISAGAASVMTPP